jgi:hypothetical protein
MRLLIVGKSQLSGKGVFIGNLLLRPFDETDKEGKHLYMNDFKGDNIYVISPSTNLDTKWQSIIKDKKIPEVNIIKVFNEEILDTLYQSLEERFHEAVSEGRKPEHSLVIFDDMSFSGDLKNHSHGGVARLFMNGRHLLISTILTAQKYTDILTGARENATGLILYDSSQKQLETIYMDHGLNEKKEFLKMFREVTREPHSYLVINYSNPREMRFLNQHFEPMTIVEKD